MTMNWDSKVILVTGGAHRLGKAMALRAANMGAHVAITYHKSATLAEETCAEIVALGRNSIAVQCDQADSALIRPAVEKIIQKFKRLDGLVNSASVFYQKDFFDISPDDWDKVIAINTRGPFFFTQVIGQYMQENDGGVIINIIDESAMKPSLSYPHHTISKAGLWSLTRYAALRLAPKIRVNAILPGAVLKPPDWKDEHWQSLKKHIPLDRLGSPKDVCDALEYLLRSDFVTGQMIVTDGGETI